MATDRELKAVKIKNASATLTLPTSTATLSTLALSETLTNKTLTSPITTALAISDYEEFTEVAAPSSPAATKHRVYFKSDGKMYRKNSGGTETEVGAASASYLYTESAEYTFNTGLNNYVWGNTTSNSVTLTTGTWDLMGGCSVRTTASGGTDFVLAGWFTANGDDTGTDPAFTLGGGNTLQARTGPTTFTGVTYNVYTPTVDQQSFPLPIIRLEITTATQVIYANHRAQSTSANNSLVRVQIYARKIA